MIKITKLINRFPVKMFDSRKFGKAAYCLAEWVVIRLLPNLFVIVLGIVIFN